MESDPFGEKGSVWSFNYFFYNKKLKVGGPACKLTRLLPWVQTQRDATRWVQRQ